MPSMCAKEAPSFKLRSRLGQTAVTTAEVAQHG